jgi:hypothetical protein
MLVLVWLQVWVEGMEEGHFHLSLPQLRRYQLLPHYFRCGWVAGR